MLTYLNTINELGAGLVQAQPARAATVTPANLEPIMAKHRASIMSTLKERISESEKLTGFCNDPISHVTLSVPKEHWNKLFVQQYRIPQALIPFAMKIIDRWLELARIELFIGDHRMFNCPLLLVPKRDENGQMVGIRICIDPRRLNKYLEQDDHFPLPRINDHLGMCAGKRVFGEMDLAEAFMQFELTPESRKYTAFSWGKLQYQFRSCPYGIKHIPSHFQRCISAFFVDMSFVFPYIDNILFASKTFSDHEKHAGLIIDRLIEKHLRLKPGAVNLCHTELRVLGRIISAFGMSMDALKREEILNWPLPVEGKNLQSMLGLTGFVADHIRYYADIVAPLHEVKKTKGKIEWTPSLLSHLTLLKQAVAAPWLKYPDFSQEFFIACDASQTGMGAVLYQPEAGTVEITPYNIIAICSKKFTPTELRYSAYKKELRALVYSFLKFHSWIALRKFTVFSDHNPLKHMLEQTELSNALQQWMDVIMYYHFDIIHRPGIMNVQPDQLSRLYSTVYDDKTAIWGTVPHIKFIDTASNFDTASDSIIRTDISQIKPVKPKSPSLRLLSGGGERGKVSKSETTSTVIDDASTHEINLINSSSSSPLIPLQTSSMHASRRALIDISTSLNPVRSTLALLHTDGNLTSSSSSIVNNTSTSPSLSTVNSTSTSSSSPGTVNSTSSSSSPLSPSNSVSVIKSTPDVRFVNSVFINNLQSIELNNVAPISDEDFLDKEMSIQYGAGVCWQVASMKVSYYNSTTTADTVIDYTVSSINKILIDPLDKDASTADSIKSIIEKLATTGKDEMVTETDSASTSSSTPLTRDQSTNTPSSTDAIESNKLSDAEKLLFLADKRDLFIPLVSQRSKYIDQAHAFGHYGVRAVERALSTNNIWWPGMRADIVTALNDCSACIQHNVVASGWHPARSIHSAVPGAHWQMDIAHMPETAEGYRYLLVLVDVFTRFVILRPLRDTTAPAIAQELFDIFALLGPPSILGMDNAAYFIDDIVRLLCSLLRIEHRPITPYHPQGDAIVESVIGKIKRTIAKELTGRHSHWIFYYRFSQMAYNNRIADLSGCTAFALMFNRQMNLIYDFTNTGPPVIMDDENKTEWKEFQDQVISVIFPAVEMRIKQAKEKYRQHIDTVRRQVYEKELPPGTTVVIKDPDYLKGKPKPSLKPKYMGTIYTVVRRAGNGAYILKNDVGDIFDRRVSIDQMKVLKGPRLPPDTTDDDMYEIEDIIDHRPHGALKPGKDYEYLVWWKRCRKEDATWIPAKNISMQSSIANYWRRQNLNAAPSSHLPKRNITPIRSHHYHSSSIPSSSSSSSSSSPSASTHPSSSPRRSSRRY